MTPIIAAVLSAEASITVSARAAGRMAALDQETTEMVEDAICQLIGDFLAYAQAYGLSRIPELLTEDPKLAVLGEAILGGVGSGLMMAYDELRLWFTFQREGIVLEELRIACNG